MSTPEFTIPTKPEDLAHEDCTYEVRVTKLKELKELSAVDTKTFAHGVLYDLCNESALGITEPDIFNKVYSLVNGFGCLESVSRKRLIDSLCSNLSVLGVSVNSLAGLDDEEERTVSAASHSSALKAYTFLLWWICVQAEQEARESPAAGDAAAGGGRGGKTKKRAVGHELAQWDWEAQREKLVRCVGATSDCDLWKRFRPRNPDNRLLQKWLQLGVMVLESPGALKARLSKEAAFKLLTALAHRYGQLDVVGGALVDLMNKHEHLPAALAELAEYAAQHHNDPRLGVEMLREVASVDPHDYDQQQKDDAGGIRNVAAFVQELAERLPKAVAAHISLLIPHLGGKAYALRSAIVTSVGFLVQNAYSDPPEEEADAQGSAARLRSKQHLLDTLVERARDQNAYTRARVMQTWASLAVSRSIDMGHWLCVAELGIGRLEDKSAIVRKQALLLLSSMLSFNPFAPQLPEDKFVATLEEYRRKLREVQPEEPAAVPMDSIKEETNVEAGSSSTAAEQDVAAREGEAEEAMETEGEEVANGPASAQGSEAPNEGAQAASAEISKLRATVACMDAAVGFIQAMQGALGTLTQLLASSSLSDVTESISLLICYDKFGIAGSKATLRQMLPLIFAREQGVKDAVLGAVDELCIGDLQPLEAAERLADLADGSTLGELGSLEEVVVQMLNHQPPFLKPPVLSALWQLCEGTSPRRMRNSLAIISMAAAKQPTLVSARLDLLLKIGFGPSQRDALLVRHACTALRHLGSLPNPPSGDRTAAVCVRLASVVLSSPLGEDGWYSAAEAALKAICALHSTPAAVAEALLRRLAAAAFPSLGSNDHHCSALALSRFFFLLGQAALQTLVHIEATASQVRKQRMAAEKHAAEMNAQRMMAGSSDDGSEDDIAAQVGVGSAAADADLDSLKEAAEAQIIAAGDLVGRFGGLVSVFCHTRPLVAEHHTLRSSALLALTKLMALDAAFCDTNLRLLFTLLQTKDVEPSIRSNLVIAMGDLAFRFPNLLEPWTHEMYQPLNDPDKGVVKNCLMVLTHLILNDMMKVRSHISQLALRLQDDDARIAALAQLFFHELSRKAFKGTTPVYNLLPDILSNLSGEAALPQKGFQDIMRHLLQYVGKEKHADSLVDKLCGRFQATHQLRQWRNLAFCIAQLNYTEKGVLKIAELLKSYQVALYDDEVLECFKGVIAKAKKLPKQQPEFKAEVEAFEERLLATAVERKEEEATTEAASKRRRVSDGSGNDMADDDSVAQTDAAAEGQATAPEDEDTISTAPAVKSEDLILTAPAGEQLGDASQGPMPASNEGATAPSNEEETLDPAAEREGGLGAGQPHAPFPPSASASLAADLQGLSIGEQGSSRTEGGRGSTRKAASKQDAPGRKSSVASRRSNAASEGIAEPTPAPDSPAGRRRSTRSAAKAALAVAKFSDENAQVGNTMAPAKDAGVVVKMEVEEEEAHAPDVKAMRNLWEQRRLVQQQGPTNRKASSN